MNVRELRELLAPWDGNAEVYLRTGNTNDGRADILKVFRDTRTGRNEVTLEFDRFDLKGQQEKHDMESHIRRLRADLKEAQARIDYLEEGGGK